MLVLSTELPGPCELTELELLCASPVYDTGQFYRYRLLACPTSRSALSDTYDLNYENGQPDTVAACDTLFLQWTNSQWGWVGFDSPFRYDGTANLLLEFRWQGDDGRAVYTRGWYPPGGNRTLDGYSLTSPTGTLRPYTVCMRIHYEPLGIADGKTPGEPSLVLRSTTLVRGVLWLNDDPQALARGTGVSAQPNLVDVTGRTVLQLSPGPNDVGCLAPGVYFVRHGNHDALPGRVQLTH